VRTGMAAFPVTVEIAQLTPEQRAVIHVGMTANLSIIAYDKPDAIVIPFAALHTTDAGRSVMVRRDGKTDDVPVTLGISTPAGVEIRSGLKPGDIVEMP
jgi:multidrug efflux pump subunit AcrA (membrane-fusion protein)